MIWGVAVMAGGMVERVPLFLAVLWHDPPWKPWGMLVRTRSGETVTIDHVEGKFYDVIKKAVENKLKNEKNTKSCNLLEEFEYRFEELTSVYKATLKRKSWSERSHEIQALIIPALVSAYLKCGANTGNIAAGLAYNAGMAMARLNPVLKCADSLASAVDRSLVDVLESGGDERKGGAMSSEFRVVNPFNPELEVRALAKKLSPDKIAEFLVAYAKALKKLMEGALENCKGGRPEMCIAMVLRDGAYLLLEPLWYSTFGEEYYRYMPPADTRIPTHTVFDHANAALGALNWCGGDGTSKPRGFLAFVDLAGVQSWIRESRRLRDLWASSWMASLLAWKSIENLVEEYGPGILIQPPGRLHPFLAAKLAGATGNPEIDLPGGGSTRLTRIIGLSRDWPVDTTVPTRILLALPPEVGEEELRRRAVEGISRAWKEILEGVERALESVAGFLEDKGFPPSENGLPKDLIRSIDSLEPPLSLRIASVDVCESFGRVLEKAPDYIAGVHVGRESVAQALYYAYALHELSKREGTKIRVPGRRVGRGYYRYVEKARRAYSVEGSPRPPTCTVCGKSPAVVDGTRLEKGVGKLMGSKGRRVELSLLAEMMGERLCPYCLSKRLLRSLLYRGSRGHGLDRLDRRLVGLDVSPEAKKLLDFTTIDALTSRVRLHLGELKEVAAMLGREVKRARGTSDAERVAEILPEELKHVAIVGNTLQPPAEGHSYDPVDAAVQSVVLELALNRKSRRYLHEWLEAKGREGGADKSITAALSRVLDSVARASRRARAKTALVAMDGDFLGKGVLAGRLPVKACDYINMISNIHDPEGEERFKAGYKELLDLYEKTTREDGQEDQECPACVTAPERSLIVTLSYHFSVSRALAVQASLDREIVEKNGGMLIYAGGDDVLAFLPPVGIGKDRKLEFPAVRAVLAFRRSYWGLEKSRDRDSDVDDIPTGFNALSISISGQDRDKAYVAVAPALASYGRSGVLYMFDVSTPLWVVLSHAWDLEEEKDRVVQLDIGPQGYSLAGDKCKDVLVIFDDSSGSSIIPFNTAWGKSLGSYVEAACKIASLTARLEGQKRELSPSIYNELFQAASLLEEMARLDPGISVGIVRRSIDRHKQAEELDLEQAVPELFKPCSYTRIVASSGEAPDSMPISHLYTYSQGCRARGASLILNTIMAARALHSSK